VDVWTSANPQLAGLRQLTFAASPAAQSQPSVPVGSELVRATSAQKQLARHSGNALFLVK
jgi:hypothetical protein